MIIDTGRKHKLRRWRESPRVVPHSTFQKQGGEGTVVDKVFGLDIPRVDAIRVKGGWVHRDPKFGSFDRDDTL